MDVSVVVATFGDRRWVDLAYERAIPSALALGVPVVIHAHKDSLHEARNVGLEQVDTEWVCYLDADDELEPGYFDAMEQATADLRAPSVRYITPQKTWRPKMPRVAGHVYHDCTAECLAFGNWLIVGSLVRADMVRAVGGWREYPIYEDWDLWVRCWQAGATIEAVTRAIYRAYVREDSRNRGPGRDMKHATHQAIARANGIPVPV